MNANLANEFADEYFKKSGRFVPGRLQAALALLERVRTHPVAVLGEHLATSRQSLISHETLGEEALARFKLPALNKNHGRRSSNIGEWGQQLLDLIKDGRTGKVSLRSVESIQASLAALLREVAEGEPMLARLHARSGEAVVADLLDQAAERNAVGRVAQYLVGAKLMLRFPNESIPVRGANEGNRRRHGDTSSRAADFEIGNAAIEVATGTPDDWHMEQIAVALEESSKEFWLLVRASRLVSWNVERNEIARPLAGRLVITPIESFVGQNVSELGGFRAEGIEQQLRELIRIYNHTWIASLENPSLSISIHTGGR